MKSLLKNHSWAWLLTALLPALATAQVDDRFFNPQPESGRWFADDGTLTGFFLEIQDGIVAGLYVGADGMGNNIWLNFSGRLNPVIQQQIQVGWRLESELYWITGNGCILGCDTISGFPAEPIIGPVGAIELVFSGRTAGEFSIDGTPPVPIRPIQFGVIETEGFPDLAGTWAVAIAAAQQFPEHNAAALVEIGPGVAQPLPIGPAPASGTAFLVLRHPIIRDRDDVFADDSAIECTFRVAAAELGLDNPACQVISSVAQPRFGFTVNRDWISDSRITMIRSSSGGALARLDFHRLKHD